LPLSATTTSPGSGRFRGRLFGPPRGALRRLEAELIDHVAVIACGCTPMNRARPAFSRSCGGSLHTAIGMANPIVFAPLMMALLMR